MFLGQDHCRGDPCRTFLLQVKKEIGFQSITVFIVLRVFVACSMLQFLLPVEISGPQRCWQF